MAKTSINPESLFQSKKFGFSQIVVSQGSRTVRFSGQVAWDENENIIGENDLRAQVWQSLRNVKTAMEAAGGTLEDIVSLRIYIVHDWMEEAGAVGVGLREFFTDGHPPTATWIGVPSLARPEFLVEIEGTAVLD